MAVITAVGLMACGNSDSDTQDNGKTSSEVNSDSESSSQVTATSSDFTLTLENVDDFIETLAPYEGREVSVASTEISDEMLDYYASYLFYNDAYSIEGWVADNGDVVVMDYVGKIDDVAFDGGTASGATLELGSNSYIPGFEEGLIGTKAGDTVDLNLTFPDPYDNNPDLAGKPCVFTVTVTKVVPGLSDEAVVALGNPEVNSKEEYMAAVKATLEEYYGSSYESDVVQAVIDLLVDESVFKEISPELLAVEEQLLISNYESEASTYGLTVPEYFEAYGASMEEVEIYYAKQQIVFYKVAKEIGVTVSEADIDSYVQDYINEYSSQGITSEADVYNYVATRGDIYEAIVIGKVYDHILDVTKVTQPAE